MKVLYLSACGKIGGAERSLLDLIASIRAHRPDVLLHVVTAEDGPLVSECRALGASATVLSLPRRLAQIGDAAAGGPAGKLRSRWSLLIELLRAAPAVTGYVLKLRRVIRAFAPEIIHSNGFKMHLLAALTTWKTPIVWHIHDYVSARPMMNALLSYLSQRCTIAVANSESVAVDVKAALGPRLAVHTIYNAVDLETFSSSGPALDLDSLTGLPRPDIATIRIGMLGTFARWKGHETFLRAMALLSTELPVRGYIIGDALYQTNGSQHSLNELKEQAAALGVSDRVGFTGFIDQPAAAIRALDIVVHASTAREPFGLVIAEAMACGKPIIIADRAGAAELITLGVDALSHVPADAKSLAGRIARLASDAALRMSLGNSARLTAERCFDRLRLAIELPALYQETLDRTTKRENPGPNVPMLSSAFYLRNE